MFATLDTTTRQLYLVDAQRSVSLSDTVGFIRDLPHGLVDAFQATLQEAVDADLLLHVVDASNADFPEQMAQVERVLREIGAVQIPQILVFNKLDSIPAERRPALLMDQYEVAGNMLPRLFVSAKTGEGVGNLRSLLATKLVATPLSMTPDASVELPDVLP